MASVETDDMDEAFRLTNHIDSDWMENKRVKAFVVKAFVKQARSTSVGDVFMVWKGDKGKPQSFIVAPIGFKPVIISLQLSAASPIMKAAEEGKLVLSHVHYGCSVGIKMRG